MAVSTIGSLKEKSAGLATGSSSGRRKSKARKQGTEPQPGDYGYRPPVDPMPIGENVEVDQIERVEDVPEVISEEERRRRWREANKNK